MARFVTAEEFFAGRRFDGETLVLRVRWSPSFRFFPLLRVTTQIDRGHGGLLQEGPGLSSLAGNFKVTRRIT